MPRLEPDLTISPRVGPGEIFENLEKDEKFHTRVKLCDFLLSLKAGQISGKGPFGQTVYQI